jgi:hypothetical protein
MKRVVPALLLFIALAGLTAVIVDLLQLRLESGDVYPPYSSLRSDPLGTMVLFESLGRTRDLAVRRDYSTAGQMPDAVGTTYLHLSASPEDWRRIQPEEFNTIDRFVREGGRLVIALRGVPAEIVHIDRTISEAEKNAEKEKQRKAEEQAAVKLVSAEERWGFQTQLVNLKQEEESNYIPAVVQNVSTMTMPATLQWYSGIVLTNLHSEWKPVYARDGQPVIAERQFGKGAVVLATDSFFLSNEAMAEARHPELLVWLIGSGSTVFFDEAHLGIVDRINPRIVDLSLPAPLAGGQFCSSGRIVCMEKLEQSGSRSAGDPSAVLRDGKGIGRRICQFAAPQYLPARAIESLFQ